VEVELRFNRYSFEAEDKLFLPRRGGKGKLRERGAQGILRLLLKMSCGGGGLGGNSFAITLNLAACFVWKLASANESNDTLETISVG
jgi:hypothetical protein